MGEHNGESNGVEPELQCRKLWTHLPLLLSVMGAAAERPSTYNLAAAMMTIKYSSSTYQDSCKLTSTWLLDTTGTACRCPTWSTYVYPSAYMEEPAEEGTE